MKVRLCGHSSWTALRLRRGRTSKPEKFREFYITIYLARTIVGTPTSSTEQTNPLDRQFCNSSTVHLGRGGGFFGRPFLHRFAITTARSGVTPSSFPATPMALPLPLHPPLHSQSGAWPRMTRIHQRESTDSQNQDSYEASTKIHSVFQDSLTCFLHSFAPGVTKVQVLQVNC